MSMRQQSGMTLIEILVAMSILAILSVMGYKAFSSLLIAREHLMGTAQEWINLSRTFHRMELDIKRATVPPVYDSLVPPSVGMPLNTYGPFSLKLGEDNAQILRIHVFSNKSPEGMANIIYRAPQSATGVQWGNDVPWSGVNETSSNPPVQDWSKLKFYTLPASHFQFEWQVLLQDGRRVKQWPLQGDEKALPTAIICLAKNKQGDYVQRVWSLQL